MSKTIKLDSDTIVQLNKVEAIYRYNKWNIKVYVSGNVFKIKVSQNRDNAEKITNLFIKSLETLVDPDKDRKKYEIVRDEWKKHDGTFKEFIIDKIVDINLLFKY